jgi:DNA polymerase II large subunit
MRPEDEQYFQRLEAELDSAFEVARTARERGGDPTEDVEIPTARDMADRVENILGIDGVAERVRELEGEMSREEAALELVSDFVEGTVGDYDTKAGKIEGAVRTAVALLTEGVVAAPIEGIDRVEVLDNDDGTEFVNVYYAGPIRSAGGTAQALSVLVADYARTLLGMAEYKPYTDEIGRYAEEIELYDKDTGLQYSPKEKETKFIAEHMPIMLDGEATGDEEVSGFRDLQRVETNSARGGMCLVLAEGIALKAPKIQRYTRNLAEVEWPWLQDLIDATIGEDGGGADDADDSEGDEESEAAHSADGDEADPGEDGPAGPPRVEESEKFLRDLIAGRPVFSHSSEPGGFRLRYGRARNHGFATAGVHPATMHLVDDFLATGTQIKTERPGKAAGVVPVDSIEGPTVRLANGDVRRIDDPAEALEVRNGVEAILDVGEYLVNYGEFVENNHPLAPASYTVEWWEQDLEASGADVQAMRDSVHVDLADPTAAEAIEWATEYDAPLHPKYTYCWHDVTVAQFDGLAAAVADGEVVAADGAVVDGSSDDAARGDLAVPRSTDTDVATVLEHLLVEHHQGEDRVTIPDWLGLVRSLGLTETLERTWTPEDLSTAARNFADGDNAIRAVNEVAPFEVRERAPTRVGNRMGRPEKSESRELSPAVHTLFPIGEAGGSQRDVSKAAAAGDEVDGTLGEVEVEVGRRECPDCGERTVWARCPACNATTDPVYVCWDCDVEVEHDGTEPIECHRCEGRTSPDQRTTVSIRDVFQDALDAVGERENAFDIVKGVKGLTSREKTPEPIEKGILRAKHGVSAFKDGTVRYDMTDLPVTAVRPAELDVTADQFRALGYETDIHGDHLQHDDQLVELKVQDVVLSDGAAEHMLKTAAFVDDLLASYYGLDPYYEFDDRDDLVGELVFGMAPHTSAATVGRIIGFTTAAVGYAHPYFHAAKRRNCFHPKTKVWFEDESGLVHYDTIETLVEDRLDEPRTDDFGTLVEELDADISVPSVDSDGNVTRKPIEAISKHPAPDHLLRIETRSGRQLTVTPEHSMRRVADGVERVDARDLSAGDSLPTPKALDFDGQENSFDLLAEFLELDSLPNDELMIREIGEQQIKDLFDQALDGSGYLEPVAEYLGKSQSAVYNWLNRDTVPVSVFVDLYGVDGTLERIPDDVTLSIRRETASLDRHLQIDARFGTVLGYYAAEGFTQRSSGNLHQTTICIPDEKARDLIPTVFDDALSVEASEENRWKVTVSSRLMAALFTDVFAAGDIAETKCVPDCILSGPDEVLRAFLAAYFSGDGSVSGDRIEIRAHTVSDALKRDLVAALKRFGIASKTYSETRTPETGAVAEFDDGNAPESETWVLKIPSENAVRFEDRIGFHLDRKAETLTNVIDTTEVRSQRIFGDGGDLWLDEIVSVEPIESDVEYTYSVTVSDTNTLVADDVFTGQCDGDEDCVMLLLDGLLNFSRYFLPDKRGGKMDAPLVMSSRIDPTEIDDEAHNVDIVDQYPREFYEATREMADPGEVEDLITIAEENLGTDREYTGFRHTHDTSNIALGPDLSAYKTLDDMMAKMDAQLELSRNLRAVDETDVAERVIEYHFLPDIIGNLRAFSRQETRCLDCGEKYRRVPLTGDCRECGGDMTLTVHHGSVTKYIDTAIEVAEEYGSREYTKQRLEILDKSIERIFENDHNKQSGIGDFM